MAITITEIKRMPYNLKSIEKAWRLMDEGYNYYITFDSNGKGIVIWR